MVLPYPYAPLEKAVLYINNVRGVVACPGPPFVKARTLSNTLSVPLMLKMRDENRIGVIRGRTTERTSRNPEAPFRLSLIGTHASHADFSPDHWTTSVANRRGSAPRSRAFATAVSQGRESNEADSRPPHVRSDQLRRLLDRGHEVTA